MITKVTEIDYNTVAHFYIISVVLFSFDFLKNGSVLFINTFLSAIKIDIFVHELTLKGNI